MRTTESRRLVARLHNLNDEVNTIQAKAEAEGRDLTEAEEQELQGKFAEFRDIENQLDGYEGEHVELPSQGRKTEPNRPRPQNRERHTDLLRQDAKTVRCHYSQKPIEGRRYRDVFGAARAADKAGFADFEEFLVAVHSGMAHPKLIDLQNANNVEGIGTDGGYLVPTHYTSFLNDKALEAEIIRSNGRIYNALSNEVAVPQLDVYDHSTDLANLQGGWIAEATEGTAETAKFRSQTFRLHKLMLITKSSNELLQDGVGFEMQLTEGMSARLAYKLDQAFLYGTGAGQPTGLLNCPSKISVAKGSGQAADTVIMGNLVDMYSRLHPACFRTAMWLCSPSVMQQLITLNWTGSQVTVPAWTSGISGSLPTTIFGVPLRVTEHCKPVGDQGDIILYDTQSYGIAQRADFTLARSGHTGFMSDETAWRLTIRVDGQSLWPEAVTPIGGDQTLSNIVVLDDRA